ncbi:MAG TPA: AAA family ATPase [Candidatus Limnocylindrales bacterium]|nr:AAA family ATPase [Candidatus Limnocylindrales bacterium]
MLKQIASTSPRVGTDRLIAIDGHGGSGKTTLAEMLSKQLNAEIIYTDDFASRDNPKEFADLILDGTKPFKEQV